MNIQFMTEANARKRINRFGKEETIYAPDWDKLIANASCEEEIEMLKNCRERQSEFVFKIVFTIYKESLVYDTETHKQKWVTHWTIYQHPWYRTEDDVYASQEEMIEIIEKEQAQR